MTCSITTATITNHYLPLLFHENPIRPKPKRPLPGALVASLVQTLRPQEVQVVSPVATVTCEADCSGVEEMAGFWMVFGWFWVLDGF